jgi:hypothetical protein
MQYILFYLRKLWNEITIRTPVHFLIWKQIGVQVKINTWCEHVPLRSETSQSDTVWNQQILIDRARTRTWHRTLWLSWNMPLDLCSCTAWQNVLLSKELKMCRITHWCLLWGFILAYRQHTLQLDVKIKRSWSWWQQQLWLLLCNFR